VCLQCEMTCVLAYHGLRSIVQALQATGSADQLMVCHLACAATQWPLACSSCHPYADRSC
jgi:hypothetical protein